MGAPSSGELQTTPVGRQTRCHHPRGPQAKSWTSDWQIRRDGSWHNSTAAAQQEVTVASRGSPAVPAVPSGPHISRPRPGEKR